MLEQHLAVLPGTKIHALTSVEKLSMSDCTMLKTLKHNQQSEAELEF